jgi:alcohol dehydrogenase
VQAAGGGDAVTDLLGFTMKALVYHGPGVKAWEVVARPTLVADTDAIVRVDTTTICGTDLHILKGDVPAMVDGRIIGHEAVGTVAEVGAAVQNMAVGDRVLVSCVSACGACRFCRESRYGQCTGGGGWILGNEIDGTQAEYVRVPFADNSTYPVLRRPGESGGFVWCQPASARWAW